MHIQQNVPLAPYSTMRLGGSAAYLTDLTTKAEVPEALAWAKTNNLPVVMIGGGSNLVWTDNGFPGLVLVNKIMGFEAFNEDDDNLYVTVGAGEVWDSVIERCVNMGYSGIEQLSLIPGSTGATPIQNVGAYGREIAEVLVSVEAYDSQQNTFINIPKIDCGFAYRTSRFKTTDKGRFFITAVTLHLIKQNPLPPFYGALQDYFTQRSITNYTPQVVREAVIAIRTSKLPDPAKVPNTGSFFANPRISPGKLQMLQDQYPNIVYWPQPDGQVKLAAAWLVEQAGFKGQLDPETGMATWPRQALVLINQQAHSTADLLKFKQKIVDKVKAMFDITLDQEPELIGS